MRPFGYQILFLGFLAQLGCANSHSSAAQDSPPLMRASAAPTPETEQPSVKAPPGYAAIPVSHAEAVRLIADMQDSMAMPKIQPGKGIDFDREMQSCLDMLPDNVRTQVEQAGTK